MFVRFLRSSELILVPLLGNVAIPTSWTATIPRSMRNMRGKIGWGTMSTRHSEPRLSLRISVGRGSVLVIGNEVMETQGNQKFRSAESQSGAVLKARKAHRACRIRAVCDCRGPSPKLSRRTPVLIFEPRVDWRSEGQMPAANLTRSTRERKEWQRRDRSIMQTQCVGLHNLVA